MSTPARRVQRDEQHEPATRDDLCRGVPLDQHLASVGVAEPGLAAGPPGRDVLAPFALGGERAVHDELQHRPVPQLVEAAADELRTGRVGVDDPAVLVDEHHRVPRLLECAREQCGPAVRLRHLAMLRAAARRGIAQNG